MINLGAGYLPTNFDFTATFPEHDLGADHLPDNFDFTTTPEPQNTTFSEYDLEISYLPDNFDFMTTPEPENTTFQKPDLGTGDLPDNFNFTTTPEPEKRSDVYPIQASPLPDPTFFSGIFPSYITGPIINHPFAHSVDERFYQERQISLYPQPIPFSIPVFDLQATYNSSQTTLSNSSQAHSQNSAAYNQEIMMKDEDNQIEEFSNSAPDETSEKSTTGWTKEEDLTLIELVNKIGMRWQKIAKNFSNKTGAQVKLHYQDLKEMSLPGIKKSGRWSKSENKQLASLISEIGDDPNTYTTDDWRKIATKMKSRSLEQIKVHWRRYVNPNIKKSSFTQEEDQIIIQKMKEIGKQWSLIAESLPGRRGKQIQQHYENSLDDRVRKSKWTEQEEQLLKDGVTRFENKWVTIAEFINQSMKLDTIRTGKQCFNHWRDLCNRSDS